MSSIITGKIEDITNNTSSHLHQKKLCTIVTDDGQKAFIEFRGLAMIKILESYEVSEKIVVAVKFEGKTSKNSGVNYNNIVAQSIQRV